MSNDQPRHAAASSDTDYTLSIDEAAALYERAGLPRTLRSIQRYCAKGHLDARRIETAFGEKYLISPASVVRHIAYIEEVRQATAGRAVPRLAATTVHEETRAQQESRQSPTGRDESRQVAANDDMLSRYVVHVEQENEFLRGQVRTKDDQIKDLTERARETNHLIAGLQKMLTPLLGRPITGPDDDRVPVRDQT
jgi:hypothetical protein